MRLLHEKKNRMCAMLICHFVFPSYATTSPMRIATIHSVHLPLFSNFGELFLFPQVILTAFIKKINSQFTIYLIFHWLFSFFFPFLYNTGKTCVVLCGFKEQQVKILTDFNRTIIVFI